MKRRSVCMLALMLAVILTLTACGKSAEVKAVEQAVKNIGTVTLDSGKAIQEAEVLYEALTDEDKKAPATRIR